MPNYLMGMRAQDRSLWQEHMRNIYTAQIHQKVTLVEYVIPVTHIVNFNTLTYIGPSRFSKKTEVDAQHRTHFKYFGGSACLSRAISD